MNYESFRNWIQENNQLTEDLQTWLFYRYAVANGLSGDVEVSVDSADIVTYFCLFYISSQHDNAYAFETTLGSITQILDTDADVVRKALHSLENHGLISLIEEGENLKITIQPITTQHHHHDHSHEEHHHDE